MNPVFSAITLGFVATISLSSCGGGGSGGDGDAFRSGTYNGAATYLMDGENAETCLSYARKCYSLSPYRILITESRPRGGTQKLLFSRGQDQPILANAEVGSGEVSFSEGLDQPTPCDRRGQIICTGLRETVLSATSSQERIIQAEGRLILACGNQSSVIRCDVREQATIQGR